MEPHRGNNIDLRGIADMAEQRVFHFKENHGIRYMVFDILETSGLVMHGFSTRTGGVSPEPYDSLNMGLSSGDSRENVMENRRLFGNALGCIPEESIDLEHGDQVHTIKSRDRASRVVADAVITAAKDFPLSIFFADCVPIYILDRKTPAIGLVHGGWRSTARKIVDRTLQTMQSTYGTDPKDCSAAIAPSIGPCCFLVDEDVAGIFLRTFKGWEDLIVKTSNKWSIDLWNIHKRSLLLCGIPEEQIALCSQCTSCSSKIYFSFRRDKKNSGRMAAVLSLSE
jgi:polyphenol oxidase